jgi:hypothetical protein
VRFTSSSAHNLRKILNGELFDSNHTEEVTTGLVKTTGYFVAGF